MPLLGDPTQAAITSSLKNRVPKLLGLGTPSQPRAILLITAHWSTANPTISSAKSHSLLYDYYGFPPETYELKYPAPGEPEIAAEVKAALDAAGLKPELDTKRGWDHGVFVPMLLVNPKADIPIIQISVLQSEDPERHLQMGAALARMRESNIAILGSGFASFHNLRTMMPLVRGAGGAQKGFLKNAVEWNDALTAAVIPKETDKRWAGLKGWRSLPHADDMHPPRGGEHFMPLLVCAGAANEGEEGKYYKDDFVGVDIYTYYWGA